MGFNVNKCKGPMSEINVTPFVDVMLVLLIIFMITAPLMLNGIKLDLPQTREVNKFNLSANQVILSFTKSGNYCLGKERVLYAEMKNIILQKFRENSTSTLYLRADYGISYGKVAKLMSYLKSSGITNIALVTEVEKR